MREHSDRSRQEMLYKCSCAMDRIIAQMPYEEYVDASTAYFGGQIAGERGVGVRESTVGTYARPTAFAPRSARR